MSSLATEVSDAAFDLLRAAVNIVRNEQVGTVARLKQRMQDHFPQAQATDIDAALRLWARSMA
jgi:hypothetical protein